MEREEGILKNKLFKSGYVRWKEQTLLIQNKRLRETKAGKERKSEEKRENWKKKRWIGK